MSSLDSTHFDGKGKGNEEVQHIESDPILKRLDRVAKNFTSSSPSTSCNKNKHPFVYTGKELLLKPNEEIPTLVNPLFPQKGLIAIAGSSDTGKSTLLRQLAIAVSCNEDHFLGFTIQARHSSAIYVSTEDNDQAVKFLLHKQNQAKCYQPSDYDRLRFIFDTEDLLGKLDKELSAKPADLVIIDAFSDLFVGNLNQTNDVRAFLNQYKLLSDKHDCLIAFLHHTGKRTDNNAPSKQNLLGSQGFEAKMRLVIELRTDPDRDDIRHFCLVKGNYLPKEYKNQSYELHFGETMIFTNTGERTDFGALKKVEENPTEDERNDKMVKVMNLLEQGKKYDEIAEEVKISKGTVSKWRKKFPVSMFPNPPVYGNMETGNKE